MKLMTFSILYTLSKAFREYRPVFGTGALLAVLLMLSACQSSHEVTLKQEEPLTINMNIRLEVSEEIMALLRQEQAARKAPQAVTKSIFPAPVSPLAVIEQLKQQQQVAEDYQGYLSVRPDTELSTSTRQLLAQLNRQRQWHYQQVAQRQAVALSTVERIAGEQRMTQTPSGYALKTADGQWLIKP